MARFVYEGYDEVINRNTSRGRELAGRIDKALHLAAGCVIEALQREEAGTFKAPTGEMGRILAETPEYAHGAALCLKTSNAIILRGGKEALRSNKALAAAVRAGRPPWPSSWRTAARACRPIRGTAARARKAGSA